MKFNSDKLERLFRLSVVILRKSENRKKVEND